MNTHVYTTHRIYSFLVFSLLNRVPESYILRNLFCH